MKDNPFIRRAGTVLLWLTLGTIGIAGTAFGQTTPPAELILKGKVRDFVEHNTVKTPYHPHFYGKLGHQPGCSSQQNGINIVQMDIDLTNDIGDTAVFKGDNRGPKLVSPLDPRVSQCFEPVGRFVDWYNDKPTGDINRSFLIDIKFTRNPVSGVYEYYDQDFFPINNGKIFTRLGPNPPYGHLLTGIEGGIDLSTRNYGFTMEFHANFTYFKGTNQTFNFLGDDDVWVFINGKRVIDLGGIHPAQRADVNLDAVAAAIGLQDSLVYPLDFFFAERHTTTSKLQITTTLELEPLLGTPVVTQGKFFDGQISVVASHSSPVAILYYTTDGSTPTTSSQVYTGPITISATTVLKVIAVRPGYRNSDLVTETYTKMETVATPVATPAGRIFVNPIQVVLTVATPGAVIRYTVNGSTPDSTSPIYNAPLTFSATTTLKAKAFLTNWVPSAVLTEVYTDAGTLVPPVANPVGGGFVGSQIVSLTVPGHADAQIRYTLDGSEPTASSPLYSAPLTFTAATTLKAKAFKVDWKPSQVMVEVYSRLSAAVKAVYMDFDGNGSIDGAIVRLDIPASAVPSSIRLVDPFSKAPVVLESSHITKGPSGDVLTVRFPEKQFTPGTSFAPDLFGTFPGVPGFGSQPFMVSDSVGPVPLKAVSKNKTTPEDKPSVEITFSEPINLPGIQAGLLWPFDIIRDGGPLGKAVLVSSVVQVEGRPNTYRWTFEAGSPAWPVFIDSLVLASTPTILDAFGNKGVAGGKRIPVEGDPLVLVNKMIIQLTNPIISQQVTQPVIPLVVRQNPFAVVGSSTPGGAVTCLNCQPGTGSLFTPNHPLPEWIIRSKYAFHYSFAVFDHFGGFVGRTEGQVTDAMIAQVALEPDGFRSLRFRWIPVAKNGREVGTGAYILRGLVVNHQNEAQKGSQGEHQIVSASRAEVFATFGFLRQY